MSTKTQTSAAPATDLPIATCNYAKKFRRERGEPTYILSFPELGVRAEAWLSETTDTNGRPRVNLDVALDPALTQKLVNKDLVKRAVEMAKIEDIEDIEYFPSRDINVIREKTLAMRASLNAAYENTGAKFVRGGDGIQIVLNGETFFFRAEFSKYYPVFRKRMNDDEYAQYGSASQARAVTFEAAVTHDSF